MGWSPVRVAGAEGSTNLPIRRLIPVLGQLQDIAVELRVGEAAVAAPAAEARHQHLPNGPRRTAGHPSRYIKPQPPAACVHKLLTHDAVKLCHLAAEVRPLLLQRQVEGVLQDVLIIHSHQEAAVWILEGGVRGGGEHGGGQREDRGEGQRQQGERFRGGANVKTPDCLTDHERHPQSDTEK